jgi:serine O-acetyltransferase
VTVGGQSGQGWPVLDGHVDIGVGAKILGPVRIGAHAKVGANAVVLSDVTDGTTVVEIPARPVDNYRHIARNANFPNSKDMPYFGA